MVGKDKLILELEQELERINSNKDTYKSFSAMFCELTGMREGEANQFLHGNVPLSSVETTVLFWLWQTVVKMKERQAHINDYFSETEVDLYSRQKMHRLRKSVYPIEFNVVPVANDQWLTTVSVDQLKQLSDNQVIRYNRATQRAPRTSRIGDSEVYQITIVKKSVREIKELFRKGLFIPNDLTLNLNIDNSELSWSLDEDDGLLTVENGVMDIIDGYHRFLAAMELKAERPDFCFTFVLNIMSFDTDKAQRFIAQEDKRNKLGRAFSKSIDPINPITSSIRRMNEDSTFALFGQIGHLGQEIINDIDLFICMDTVLRIKEKNSTSLAFLNGVIKVFKQIINTWHENSVQDITFEDSTRMNCLQVMLLVTYAKYMYTNEPIVVNDESVRRLYIRLGKNPKCTQSHAIRRPFKMQLTQFFFEGRETK